jgi:MerR family transcriptional regulator, light-induced transcriptional regulator
MNIDTTTLSAVGLRRFQDLAPDAIKAVTERFHADLGSDYARFGPRGREACREDLSFHLEFLRPVLEFGLLQPMVDYLRWLTDVLATRGIPATHLPQSLDWIGEFFASAMDAPDGEIVVTALHRTKARMLEAGDKMPSTQKLMPRAWPESTEFETALLAGDRRGAVAVFERCLAQGRGLVDTEMHVIQPALYSIGRKWQDNQVSVAQEHLATAISQSVMTLGLVKSEVRPANGRRVLLACVAGNHHAVGLQMVSDAFQLAGWDVQFLGADVPTTALVHHLGECKPDLLGLSVSFAHQLRVVKEIMTRLAQVFDGQRPPVIIGGMATNQFASLAQTLGADSWSSDATSAVAMASKLARQPGLA